MASFVSSTDLAAVRESKRAAREEKLSEERKKYLKKEKIKNDHKRSGWDRWMLPGIEKRIHTETSKMAEVASHGTTPKQTKHKKDKKKKKNKKKGSDSGSDEEWEEKETLQAEKMKNQQDWMNFDFISSDKTFTSTSLKEDKQKEKEEKEQKSLSIQHARELNPYWKNGGKGLPPERQIEEKSKNKAKVPTISKEWLLKSQKRMNEQAEEQDRSIESVAAERYGSWSEFQKLLRDAGGKSDRRSPEMHGDRQQKQEFMRPDNYDRRTDSKRNRRSFMKPGDEMRRPPRPEKDEKRRFVKPADVDMENVRHPAKSRHRSSHRQFWKKSSSKMDRQGDTAGADKKNETASQNMELPVVEDPRPKSITPSGALPKVENQAAPVLSEKEKNQLAAKILKAELMGNDTLAQKLKDKLEKAREAEKASNKSLKVSANDNLQPGQTTNEESEEETVVLTRTGKDGQVWPLHHSDMAYDSVPSKKRKKTKVPTHREGERERYFADDDRHSLQDLVMREKTQEAEDQNSMMSRLASKQFMGADSEYFTLDDMYVTEASRQTSRTEEEARQKQKAIAEHKKLARRLESCHMCFGNPELSKHLLIAIGKKTYLMLPGHKPLSEGHCFIVPMHHCNTGTGLDEDVWEECRKFMRGLKRMFQSKKMDCVFMQTCMGLKKSRHFFIDCVPMPQEIGDMSPIYFKKAIQECESEWSHNKKLIDTRKKDVRKCVPKGLPYFSVDFGMDGGFAHVIEEEPSFPHYFGREVVGGMLDVEPRLWRHPPKDHFTEQTKRSLQFSEWWKPHDWTADVASHT